MVYYYYGIKYYTKPDFIGATIKESQIKKCKDLIKLQSLLNGPVENRIFLSHNSSLPYDFYDILSKDENKNVRKVIIENKNIPVDIFLEMILKEPSLIHETGKMRLMMKYQKYAQTEPPF